MDKLRRMEIFAAVVEARQFTKAAGTLGLSKSAVSHAVSNLESHLGVQLLERSHRHLELTEIGQTYYERATRLLADMRELEDDTRMAAQALSGRIRLTAPITFGTDRLAPIIADFTSQYPDIHIEVELSEHFVDLIRERMDFAIRITELKDSSLIARRITHINMYLCVSPDFADRHRQVTTLDHLKDLNCLKYGGTPLWPLIRNGEEHIFNPKGSVVTKSGEAIRELAIAGQGVAYLPDFLFDPPHARGDLVRFMPEFKGRPIGVYAVFPPHRHRRKHVQTLVDYIVERLGD